MARDRACPVIGDDHLTVGHAPELEVCIRRTSLGQAGWAGWHSPAGKTCAGCSLFEKERKRGLRSDIEGRCAKFRALTPRAGKGAKFSGHCLACRYYEPQA